MTATHGEGAYGNATGVTTPTEHKMAQVAEFVKTTTANVIRPGVLYSGTATLVLGKADMSYDVLPFSIATQRSATSGVMKWANNGTVNVPTTAAPGSNSRYDVVYAWHREFALDGTDSDPVIGVVQGTAAASPAVPSLAAFPGAIELARILVPAGVTATNSGTTITQTAPFTAADGSVVRFRTTTEMNQWTTALTGQLALDLATGTTYRYSGSAWVAQFDDTGWVTLPLTAGWTGETNNIPQYRRLNGVVYIRGRAAHSSGMTGVIANLPSGSRPGTSGGATSPSILQIDATTLVRVSVNIDGTVNLFTNTGTNLVSFSGIPPFVAA